MTTKQLKGTNTVGIFTFIFETIPWAFLWFTLCKRFYGKTSNGKLSLKCLSFCVNIEDYYRYCDINI